MFRLCFTSLVIASKPTIPDRPKGTKPPRRPPPLSLLPSAGPRTSTSHLHPIVADPGLPGQPGGPLTGLQPPNFADIAAEPLSNCSGDSGSHLFSSPQNVASSIFSGSLPRVESGVVSDDSLLTPPISQHLSASLPVGRPRIESQSSQQPGSRQVSENNDDFDSVRALGEESIILDKFTKQFLGNSQSIKRYPLLARLAAAVKQNNIMLLDQAMGAQGVTPESLQSILNTSLPPLSPISMNDGDPNPGFFPTGEGFPLAGTPAESPFPVPHMSIPSPSISPEGTQSNFVTMNIQQHATPGSFGDLSTGPSQGLPSTFDNERPTSRFIPPRDSATAQRQIRINASGAAFANHFESIGQPRAHALSLEGPRASLTRGRPNSRDNTQSALMSTSLFLAPETPPSSSSKTLTSDSGGASILRRDQDSPLSVGQLPQIDANPSTNPLVTHAVIGNLSDIDTEHSLSRSTQMVSCFCFYCFVMRASFGLFLARKETTYKLDVGDGL